jgi:hypothetical protein
MRYLIIIITILTITSCNIQNQKNNSIIGLEFKDFKKLKPLADYKKVVDTSFISLNNYDEFKLIHLISKKDNLVIFASIKTDSIQNENYKVLDVLTLSNLSENKKITLGNCNNDLKNYRAEDYYTENKIGLVEKTSSKNTFIKKVISGWSANPNSKKIESIKNIDNFNCFNEDGPTGKINYDLLND